MSAGKRQREIKYNGRGNLLLSFLRYLSLSPDSVLHFIHKTYFQNGRRADVKKKLQLVMFQPTTCHRVFCYVTEGCRLLYLAKEVGLLFLLFKHEIL